MEFSKVTVTAPSNIAFIKYWGARNLKRAIPSNPSVSMTLRRCVSRCTVAVRADSRGHDIRWRAGDGGFAAAPPAFAERVRAHLNTLRRWAGIQNGFQIATENSFPSAAGIASSASGFAALTCGVVRALGLTPTVEELSSLARQSGSGSAARSVLGGYVEWPAAAGEQGCYAVQLASAEHWDLRDVIAIVESGPKATSSLDGHRRARTSPYFRSRQVRLKTRLATVRAAIAARDLETLGTAIEVDAIDLHCVAMTSRPPIFYWKPGTLTVLEAVRHLRADGYPAFATMDAGANVHVICTPAAEVEVARRLIALEPVQKIIRDQVGSGPEEEDEHLF